MSENYEHYYVPEQSHWPIVGSIGLGAMVIGVVNLLHDNGLGHYLFFVGSLIMAWMMFGWFRDVIIESGKGLYSKQMDKSFRWGMAWFIFSEVMFFAGFFGALFYARMLAVPWLGGEGTGADTQALLWPNFKAMWPLLSTPNPDAYTQPIKAMGWSGLPLLNTALLVTSSITVTIAHHALRKENRTALILWLFITVALGAAFIFFQGLEYHEAYEQYHLKLTSGIYGTTFFMLTGFHGAHVTLGTIMLLVMLLRCIKGHFTPNNHFAFEAAAWYWHFVDVVWLFLFVFVYIL